MSDKQNVHLLYKNLGETPLECITRFQKEHPEFEDVPMTYAGRLDPMAEGLLLVLSGEMVHEKEKLLELPKTYRFEILWGVETDTLDVLGLVKDTNSLVPSEEEVEKLIDKKLGKHEQQYPAFSSRPVKGKPLFQWAREGKLSEIEIPSHEVEVFEASYVSRISIAHDELLKMIEEGISKVGGDFRQKEILELWQKIPSREWTIDTVEMKVSGGFYVRQFIADLAKQLGSKAIAYSIKRIQIGSYQLS